MTKFRWHLWLCNDKQAKALTASICGTPQGMFGVWVSRDAENSLLTVFHNFSHSVPPGRQSRILQDWFAVPQIKSHSSPSFSTTSIFTLPASLATFMHRHHTPPTGLPYCFWSSLGRCHRDGLITSGFISWPTEVHLLREEKPLERKAAQNK